MLFCAGIVTFNPDVYKLNLAIKAIYPQVNKIFLVDNGSDNFQDLSSVLVKYDNVEFVFLGCNKGIAFAHNKICELSEKNGFEWTVLLDQDSEVPLDIVKTYSKYIGNPKIGMLCAKTVDRNFGQLNYLLTQTENMFVETCIASASAIRISAWKMVGGFCDEMFIDSVDTDMCLLLHENGFKIFKINKIAYLHEVGNSTVVKLGRREYIVLNHSPVRYYYMVRNAFLLARRHGHLFKCLKYVLLKFILVNMFENNKIKKNRMMLKGVLHGTIGRFGKYE